MNRSDLLRRLELFEGSGDIPVPASWLRAVLKEPYGATHDGNADRLPPVLAAAKRHKADREEKAWLSKSTSTRGTAAGGKASAAKSRRGAK